MGICLDRGRLFLKLYLEDIVSLKVEPSDMTPMEILQFREVQKKCEEILKEFDNCTEYLNNR